MPILVLSNSMLLQGMNLISSNVLELQEIRPTLDVFKYILSQPLEIVSLTYVPVVSEIDHLPGGKPMNLGVSVDYAPGEA